MLLRKRFDRKTALSHLAGTRKATDDKKVRLTQSSPALALGQGRVVSPALSYLTVFSRRYIRSKIKKVSKISRRAFARFQECVNLALTFRRFQRRIGQRNESIALAVKVAGKYGMRASSIAQPNSALIAVRNTLTYLSSFAKMKKRNRLLLISLRNKLQGNRFCQRVTYFFFQPVFLKCFHEWKEYLCKGGLSHYRSQQCDAHRAMGRRQYGLRKWLQWTQQVSAQKQRILKGIPYLWQKTVVPALKLLERNTASRNAFHLAASVVVLSRALRRLFVFSRSTKYFSSALEMRLHQLVKSGGLHDRQRYIHLSNASCLRILRFQDNGLNMNQKKPDIIGTGSAGDRPDRADLGSVVMNLQRYMVHSGGRSRQAILMTSSVVVYLHRWVRFATKKKSWERRREFLLKKLYFKRFRLHHMHAFRKQLNTASDNQRMKSVIVRFSDKTSTASERLIKIMSGKCEYYPTMLRRLRQGSRDKEFIHMLNEFITMKSPIHGRQKRKQQDFEHWMNTYISENYTLTLSSIIGDSIADTKLCRHTLRQWLKKRRHRIIEKNHIRSPDLSIFVSVKVM